MKWISFSLDEFWSEWFMTNGGILLYGIPQKRVNTILKIGVHMTVLPYLACVPRCEMGRVTAFSQQKLESVRADHRLTDQ